MEHDHSRGVKRCEACHPALRKPKAIDGLQLPIETIIQLTFAREQTRLALTDLLAMFDRRDDHGWTYAEVARLEEIRKVAECENLTTLNNRP